MNTTKVQEKALASLVALLERTEVVEDALKLAEAITRMLDASPVNVTLVFDDGDGEGSASDGTAETAEAASCADGDETDCGEC